MGWEHPKPTAYTHPQAKNPFADDGPDVNDVTAALFLLLRTQDITSDVFICPSTTDRAWRPAAGGSSQDASNFPSRENLSYSMNDPYPSAAVAKAGYMWNHSLAAGFCARR